MKVCPRCQKTYTDENLNFCLEDGSVLTQASAAAPPATEQVLINQTRMPPPPNQPGAQRKLGQRPAAIFDAAPGQKGLENLGVGCGNSGPAGPGMRRRDGRLFRVGGVARHRSRGNSITTNPSPSPTATSTTTTNSTSGRTSVQSIDMSRWVQDFSVGGNTEYTDNEFIISSKQKTYYYVLVARDTYAYDEADVSITVRNIDDAASDMGYGLIFHSNPTPLTQDYAFLIDTKKKRYRVVRHEPQKETSVVTWTNSSEDQGRKRGQRSRSER